MRHVSLVWLFLMFAGCGSITLADDAPDAGMTTAGPPQQGGGAHAPKGASAPASSTPGACEKMCPSGNGDGTDKHGGQTCDKPPCPAGDSS
jgi:hypothetical protein